MSRTKEVLYELGISPHLSGFNYLEFLIDNYSDGVSFMDSYKEAAEKLNGDDNHSRIERAVRNAIVTWYERADEKILNKYRFTSLPTVSEFIAAIKYCIDSGAAFQYVEDPTEQCRDCGAGRDEIDLLYINESIGRPYYICVTCAYKIVGRWRRHEALRSQSIFKQNSLF